MSHPDAPPHPDAALIGSLNDRIDAELRTVLDGATRVALVNFPNHANPGDPAIWLGTLAALRRLGVRIGYRCSWDTFSPTALRRALPDGPVLIHGGGNFGDLYPGGQQGLRERLLAELRGRRLVQLPQSIHFRDPANLDRMRRLVANHGDVTIMVREHRSEAIARKRFDADVRVAPDLAFALGPLDLPAAPTHDVTWLHWHPAAVEYVDAGPPPGGVDVYEVDWIGELPDEPDWSAGHRLAHWANTRLRSRAATSWWAGAAFAATFEPLADAWLLRGLHVLASGRVLVSDKLHAHILAVLAGLPHVALDNSYGKVSAVHQAWTSTSASTRWAGDGDAARAAALDLLDTVGTR